LKKACLGFNKLASTGSATAAIEEIFDFEF
jgi:hypothetical protein